MESVWNMFSTNFIAEETDANEILANDIIEEYREGGTGGEEEDAVGEEDCEELVDLLSEAAAERVPKIKDEPEDEVDDEEEGIVAEDFLTPEQVKTEPPTANDEGDDDDTIFNFGSTIGEPQVQIRVEEPNTKSSSSSNALQYNEKQPNTTPPLLEHEDDKDINYESAVVYICPACGSEFDIQYAWKRHMNLAHDYNTPRGLNFVQLDKLYYECQECHKRIAMHAMENLFKHKFTHLPFRCTKCRMCLRQYKYRQDLMVHLRMMHYDDLAAMTKSLRAEEKQKALQMPVRAPPVLPRLAIKDIKENAVDIFENTFADASGIDGVIEVKNELIEPDDDDEEVEATDIDALAEQTSSSFVLPSFLEDALSRSSSHKSAGGVAGTATDAEICEKYIQYICPQCGSEYGTQSQWRQHIEFAHDFGSRQGLNFQEVNMNQNAQCMECKKVLQVNVIRNLQMHKFTHLPHKSWMRCKLCFRAFVGQKEIIAHLIKQHCVGNVGNSSGVYDADESQDTRGTAELDDMDDDTNQLLTEQTSEQSSQSGKGPIDDGDPYEPHIDYLCPQCGREYFDRKLWRKHIVQAHQLADLAVLNFKIINERQVMCLECDKIITNAYGVQNAQQHRITHMPYKAFIRCRLCGKSYTDRKGLTKHLRTVHTIGDDHAAAAIASLLSSAAPTPSSSFSAVAGPSSSLLRPMPPLQPKPHHQQHQPQQQLQQRRVPQQREIVKHANFTYEIQYLDEGDDAAMDMESNANSSAPSMSSSFSNSFAAAQLRRDHKCADCGSLFGTPQALQRHMSEEHEFLDFNNLKPLSQEPRRWRSSTADSNRGTSRPSNLHSDEEHSQSNDADLLVPSTIVNDGDNDNDYGVGSAQGNNITIITPASVTPSSSTSTYASVERYFCYLCPACGIEYKAQMDWRRHINETHNFDKRHYLNFRPIDKFRFQCTTCNDIVANNKLKGLQDHKFRHLPHKLYIKCLICGNKYNHKPNMLGHLRTRHNIKISETQMRNAGGGGHGDFWNNNEYVPAPPRPFQTPPPRPISLSISTAIAAAAAAKATTSGGTPIAPHGNKPPGLKTVEDCISFHNAVDHDTITYFCPQCNVNFDTHVFWRKHIVEEHNLNSRQGLNFRQIDEHHYLCLQCYKRVTVTHTKGAIGQLQSHKFRHLPFKSFKCTHCLGEFVRKQMFFKHLNKLNNRCTTEPTDEALEAERAAVAKRKLDAADAAVVVVDAAAEEAAEESDDEVIEIAPVNKPSLATLARTAASSSSSGSGSFTLTDATAAAHFILSCPQCGEQFDVWRLWREHINIVHQLGNRAVLNFTKISATLHQCLQCHEHVNGIKLRDLQIHKFKHLPHGAHIQCRYCQAAYYHVANMTNHLRQKHPQLEQGVQLEPLSNVAKAKADDNAVAGVDEDEDILEDTEMVELVEEPEDDDQFLLG